MPRLFIAFAFLIQGGPGMVIAQDRPPNVVLIVVDDLGWADLGCTGSIYYETPHLDRLAAEGVRFTQAYAACAVCSPSRAAILTGRYPTRSGITDWIRPLAGQEWDEESVRGETDYVADPKRRLLTPRVPRWLERNEKTLAELLHDAGYATGFIGKWHLGPAGWFPEDQGFDFNAGGCDFGHPPNYFDPYPADHQRTSFPNLPPRAEGEYLTDREADEAVGFIGRHAEQSFFLMLAHYAVHSPIQAKADIIEQYESKPVPEGDGQRHAPYAAMVHSVDDATGRIVDTLRAHDILSNTLIIFTSDNGGATHFDATDNRPLRSGKGRPYEGGLRVPFIMRWSARIAAGRVDHSPINSIDVLPTVLEAAGVGPPDGRELDGESIWRMLIDGDHSSRETMYWHYPHYWWGGRLTPYSVVRHRDLKLIRWYETGDVELYDLAADPGEATNLAETRVDDVARLTMLLDDWLQRTGALLPRPNPAYVPADQ